MGFRNCGAKNAFDNGLVYELYKKCGQKPFVHILQSVATNHISSTQSSLRKTITCSCSLNGSGRRVRQRSYQTRGTPGLFKPLDPMIFKYTLFDLYIFSLTQIICKNADLHNHHIAGARKWLH